jgi:thiamine-phosphate pyrophosphorylase
MTSKPLVAIGGITLANFREVLRAGADSVAVIAELITNPAKTAAQFLVE